MMKFTTRSKAQTCLNDMKMGQPMTIEMGTWNRTVLPYYINIVRQYILCIVFLFQTSPRAGLWVAIPPINYTIM